MNLFFKHFKKKIKERKSLQETGLKHTMDLSRGEKKKSLKNTAKEHQKEKVNILYVKPKRKFIILIYFSCFVKVRSMITGV